MSNEIYKKINGFSNYEISNFGNLRNKTTEYIFKPSIKSGYLCTSLIDDTGEKKPVKIHRLVALTFIPNLENKYTVNHKDHNKLNNNLDNLEWMTATEQNNHKRKPTKEVQELISSRAVWRIDMNTNKKLELFKTIKFASEWVFNNKLTSITEFNNGNNIKTSICSVARGKRNTAFGYKWEYDNSDENIYQNEIWKKIPKELINVDNYQISNYGRVKNHKGRITKGSNHESGYLRICILLTNYSLHRLVAKVFIPNPENKEQVNHIDGNKLNSHVSNLEWCTNTENQIHKVNTGLSNRTNKIIQYDLEMNKINEFNSQIEASKKLNISYSANCKCCSKKQKSTGGFIFELVV